MLKLGFVVQITDSCPECESNHFDIQALTFNKVRECISKNGVSFSSACMMLYSGEFLSLSISNLVSPAATIDDGFHLPRKPL